MRKKILALLLIYIVNNLNNFAYAHGTGWREVDLKAVTLEFLYSDGEAMSYCEAKIYSPLDDKFAFAAMRTDELGRVAFAPNVNGQWRVAVNDNQGHRAEAKLNVTQDLNNNLNNNNLIAPQELYVRAALGVSLLFNIATFILLKRRGAVNK